MVAGSIADELMRSSNTPVLMLRDGVEPFVAAESGRISRILIALDGSARAERIIEGALALGGDAATYILACAVPPVPLAAAYLETYVPASAVPVDAEATEALVASSRQYLHTIARRLTDRGVIVGEEVVAITHHPSSLILEACRRERVDLVALASRGRGSARLFLGSVTDELLRDGSIPLLVCRGDTSGGVGGARVETLEHAGAV
jgi:nucleotide-binding universal stress UspA family protein